MPKGVSEYRDYVRSSNCVGFLNGLESSAVHSFYSNISYAFQNLEYIYRDVMDKEICRGVHPCVWKHYIKNYYTGAFSIIESILEASLIKNGTITVQEVIDPNQRTPIAKTMINTSQSSGLISQSLRDDLQTFREKRNKVHLSKILETSGQASFAEYDWNAFNMDDIKFASKCLLNLLVELSGGDRANSDLTRLFDFLYDAEV